MLLYQTDTKAVRPLSDWTRTWSKRWGAKMDGMVPGMLHAGNYCAAMHWLKAVKAIESTNADAIVAKMKQTPVNEGEPAARARHPPAGFPLVA